MCRRNLFIPDKMAYTKGKDRPEGECILCAIAEDDPQVSNLVVGRRDGFIVSLNLYPYNPGHLMVFPEEHLEDLRQLSEERLCTMFSLTRMCMDVLDELYQPKGYNLGFNIGRSSGASILHLHQHIVPRYSRELGLIDVISGTRVIVEDPIITKEKLFAAFKERGAI